jgi:hypothetical protein
MTLIGVVKKNEPGITYGEYDSTYNRMPVYLDGKRVGDIRGILNGWHYVPKGQTEGGTMYLSIKRVKMSLESL